MVLWRLAGAVSVMSCSVEYVDDGARLTIRRGPYVEIEEVHATAEHACLAAAAMRRELVAMGFRPVQPALTAATT
jgi:hypothetical protein